MRFPLLPIAIMILAVFATHADADTTRTFSIEVRAESEALDPGAARFTTRSVDFLQGCEYVRHEIELLDEFPDVAGNGPPSFGETMRRNDAGKIVNLTVAAGAYRSLFLKRGPASITVKLSVVVSCDASSLVELQEMLIRSGWNVDQ